MLYIKNVTEPVKNLDHLLTLYQPLPVLKALGEGIKYFNKVYVKSKNKN